MTQINVFTSSYITSKNKDDSQFFFLENKGHVDRFLHEYLGTDGIFVLRMVANHADVVFATELIASLWRSHYVFEERRK